MRCLKLCVGGLVLSALCAFTAPAHADTTLLSDNFNAENGGVGVLNYTGFANWNVTRGTVDLIGNGFFDFYPGNGLYVDMDGSTNAAGRLESKTGFNLTPGVYDLNFNLGGSQRGDTDNDKMTVALGGAYSEVFAFPPAAPLTNIDRLIVVGANIPGSKLSFDHTGSDDIGMIIDNVTLTKIDHAAPVPEPCSCALLALGAAPLLRRRRRA